MPYTLGQVLGDFHAALEAFEHQLRDFPSVTERIFEGGADWRDLLAYKLVPHFEGQGCLVCAVAGGTNTGKSTIFNVLLGETVSPVVATAAATRFPLIAACPRRAQQCLEGKLIPEFEPFPLLNPDAVVQPDAPLGALYVAEVASLPETLVLLDTPDVDSIEKANWVVANSIRAAGDVIVAVLTPEKYKDDRVVSFFRQARESGRVIIPLMNKANPENDYAVARRQINEFRVDVGIDGPAFVMGHDFKLGHDSYPSVLSLDGLCPLRQYIETLDGPAIKQKVHADTVAHFAQAAADFLDKARRVQHQQRSVTEELTQRAHTYSTRYDPEPGSEIGGLFHEFVQSKRGPIQRGIGRVSAALYRGVRRSAGALTGFLRSATTLTPKAKPTTDEDIARLHREKLERITHELITSYLESLANLNEPAATLMRPAAANFDPAHAVRKVVAETLRTEKVSDAFRAYANAMLEQWWSDHTGKRRVLEALDTILAVMPTAIAAPISIYTGGVGVSEAIAVAGPLIEQFVARVIEYQFGDALFDFLSPWRKEQEAAFEKALLAHVTTPLTTNLEAALLPLEGDAFTKMEGALEQCQPAS